jgi:hypothetical protein
MSITVLFNYHIFQDKSFYLHNTGATWPKCEYYLVYLNVGTTAYSVAIFHFSPGSGKHNGQHNKSLC